MYPARHWHIPSKVRRRLLAAVLLLGMGQAVVPELSGQVEISLLEGIVVDEQGVGLPHASISLDTAGSQIWMGQADGKGQFRFVLPAGSYHLETSLPALGRKVEAWMHLPHAGSSWVTLRLADLPSATVTQEGRPIIPSTVDGQSVVRAEHLEESLLERFPATMSLGGLLLQHGSSSVIEPLDSGGHASYRLTVHAGDASSWTTTHFLFNGLEATDPYQPGRPLYLPDLSVLEEATLSPAAVMLSPLASGPQLGVWVRPSGATWHGRGSSLDSGGLLAASIVEESRPRAVRPLFETFRRYTRDNLQAGGPLGRQADIFVSGTGQWASQHVVPGSAPARDSRLLFGTVRGRVRMGSLDQLDAGAYGSRINLSGGALPAGLEGLTGRPSAPPLLPNPPLGEEDHLDFIQAGWTHSATHESSIPALMLRYGFSTAHLDTFPQRKAAAGILPHLRPQSRVDLLDGSSQGEPPLSNLAVRTRHHLEGVILPSLKLNGTARHHFVVGTAWESARILNRLSTPSDSNLITVGGQASSVVQFNTPLNSLSRTQILRFGLQDRLRAASWLLLSVGLQADFSRGSLPGQTSLEGTTALRRTYSASSGIIRWNSFSPRLGLVLVPPGSGRWLLRGSFARLPDPLAGRFLDYANPNSLSGLEYQWVDANKNGAFDPGERGLLLRRFGGEYSQISRSLQRPYRDEIRLGMEAALPARVASRLEFFRSDIKRRIAAVNTGVPFSAYHPRPFLDPGPDFLPGTADDQLLTVYEQAADTLGKDAFLLANPGLRLQSSGLLAQLSGQRGNLWWQLSFTAERSFGPTNTGNMSWENDAGVLGALWSDPNSLIHAEGRVFVDRGYLGKIQFSHRFPGRLGGLELGTVATYLDGLAFGRRLLIPGLTQGPFLVMASPRGSFEDGHRTQFYATWDLRLSREFAAGRGKLRLLFDIFNLTNLSKNIRENDLSGPDFNKRLPEAVQPPRFGRFGVEYRF